MNMGTNDFWKPFCNSTNGFLNPLNLYDLSLTTSGFSRIRQYVHVVIDLHRSLITLKAK
jgi:hypothetical protein